MSTINPLITGTLRKTQKTATYWKPKNDNFRNISRVGARFLHIACQGGSSHPCPPSVTGWNLLNINHLSSRLFFPLTFTGCFSSCSAIATNPLLEIPHPERFSSFTLSKLWQSAVTSLSPTRIWLTLSISIYGKKTIGSFDDIYIAYFISVYAKYAKTDKVQIKLRMNFTPATSGSCHSFKLQWYAWNQKYKQTSVT